MTDLTLAQTAVLAYGILLVAVGFTLHGWVLWLRNGGHI
jgi:hypothetical protein